MEDKEILEKIQKLEEEILLKVTEWDKLLKEFKTYHKEVSDLNTDKVFYQQLIIPTLNVCLDKNLYKMFMEDNETLLSAALADLRTNLLEDYGYVVPHVEINYLDSLPAYNYMIFIRNELVYKDKIDIHCMEPQDFIIDKLRVIVFQYADKIISRETIWSLLRNIEESDKTIIEDLMSQGISIGTLRQTLVNLLKERIPIKDIRLIFEKIAEFKLADPLADTISEKLRDILKYNLINDFLINDKIMDVILLAEDLETTLIDCFDKNNTYQQEILGQMIYDEMSELSMLQIESACILLVNPSIRLNLYRLIEKHDPTVRILASNEVDERIGINILGTIDIVKCYDIDDVEFYQDEDI